MKIAILSREEITSKKDGAKYVKYTGFSKTGSAIEAFITAEKDTLSSKSVPLAGDVEAVFSTLPQVDVEFNNRGRVESIEEIEGDV